MADEKNIKFIGNQINRDESLKFVDRILKEKEDFKEFDDLSRGLYALSDTHKIQISDDDDCFSIALESFEKIGERMEFVIGKATEAVYKVEKQTTTQKVNDDDIDFLEGI